MPKNLANSAAIIKTLPVNEVFILNQTNEELLDLPAVFQNFVKDIYEAMLV